MAERFFVPSETAPSWAWPVPRNVNNNRQLKMMVLRIMEDLVSVSKCGASGAAGYAQPVLSKEMIMFPLIRVQ